MTNRVPASPSLSPGRRLFRAVPQSPALGFRAPSAAVTPGPSLAARHTKSTSDLNQAGQSRYDPSRISGGYDPSRISGGTPSSRASRGASPPPPISPRDSTSRASEPGYISASSRPYTPYAPGSSNWSSAAVRSASPSSVSAPQWPNNSAATRVGSADGRPAQWTGSTGSSRSFAKVSTLGALDASSTQPSSHLAPSWSSSPRTAVLAGSASRSWSQSSQGRRVEPLSPWVSQASVPTSALQANQPSEKDSGTASPHPQTSRRAPSHTYLQAVGAGQNGGMKPSSLPDGHYEAQMANLRNSLLQHIQSVQKEITRLQLERQRAQTQGTSPAVSERQQSANVLQTNGQVATAAPAIAVALCSPQSTSRGVSSERERSGGDSSGYRWRRQHQIRRDSNAMGSGQAPSSVGSKDRLPPEVSCQPPTNEYVNAVTKVQRFW